MADTKPTEQAAKTEERSDATLRTRLSRVGVVGPLIVPVAALVVLSLIILVVSPEFFTVRNMLNVARQASIVGVVAVGMTVVILTRGIDLSVGSTLALSAVTVATLINAGMPVVVVAVAGILVGTAVGLVNGVGVAKLGIQPFIMTLAMLVAVRGVALRVTGGGPEIFSADSAIFNILGAGTLGPIPGPFIVFLLGALAGWLILRYTTFGRHLYAIGGSPEAARLSGVRTPRTLLGAYAISGSCAGVAGLMTASRLSTGDPTAGTLLELNAIAAVVIGGTSLMGGVGGVSGTVIGAMLLAFVANVMNLFGVSPFDQNIVMGAVIVVAVLIGAYSARARAQSS